MMLIHDIVVTVLVMAFSTLGASALVMWMVKNEDRKNDEEYG